jgi:sugar phosphate isomerase/epimerase
VALLHVKDMADGPEQRFAPVGAGKLKFGPILQAAAKAGVKWAIVEQDNCYDTPPIEAVRTSFMNLKKLLSV